MNLLGALLHGLLAASGAFVLGMRARSPRLRNAVRRFNRAVPNPRQLRSAGSPGAYASLIRLTAGDRRFHRLFGIDQRLRVRRVEPQGAADGQPRR